jgi:hypothetical protein
MNLSPRQVTAYLEFNDLIDQRERANNLMITALGSQGDGKAIEKTLKELNGL